MEASCAATPERAVCRNLEVIKKAYTDVDGSCRGELAEWAERMSQSDCDVVVRELGLNRECVWGEVRPCDSRAGEEGRPAGAGDGADE
jgi:hypothetical protein